MLNIGTGELILIAVAALLVLGPKRLPELARGIGKFLREFRRQTDEVRGVVEREFYRMDQDLNAEVPQVQAPKEAVPQEPPAIAPNAPPPAEPPAASGDGAAAADAKRPDEPPPGEKAS